MQTSDFSAGGYRFINGAFQYSGGVAALPGYRIERVRFMTPMPLAEGFARIGAMLKEFGRPTTAFCACELRSPAPFSGQGFIDFNRQYVTTLEKWQLFDGIVNPVARSNVCPEIGPPATPSFHAFSFTLPDRAAGRSCVISGSGEAMEGGASYRERTVRYGETTPDAMREKAVFVLGQLEKRMTALGCGWADMTASQVYTVHDLHPFLADEIVRRGAARAGLTWHFDRPPVVGLDFEMDCRAVTRERAVC
ncbi:MAG: 2-amino-5-chloromuconate deaminase CnbZ [Pseudolabrys sp.]